MLTVHTPNVNTALGWAVEQFKLWEQDKTLVVSPRGMKTVEAPAPVVTTYYNPMERVLFHPTRDANPFFHFFEALWMLGGRNDLEFVTIFVKRMANFSDDGERLWGAYGWRWRDFFDFDQLDEIIKLLRAEPDSRRAVLSMWSPNGDLVPHTQIDGSQNLVEGGLKGKDVPCNTHVYFKVRHGALQMTVCNRSNDAIWGCYGANAVHMSMLQEYMASKVGAAVGLYRQISDSLHVYLDENSAALWEKLKTTDQKEWWLNPYQLKEVRPLSMDAMSTLWDSDLEVFLATAVVRHEQYRENYDTTFFKDVVVPLWRGFINRSTSEVEACAASDWRRAALEWLRRREK